MFKLNNLRAPIGSNHKPVRKGKGIGSGLGKTAGKGHKGQLARAGGIVGPAFEGGQVPLERRLPKIGFRSPLKSHRIEVNLTELGNFAGQDLKLIDVIPKSSSVDPRVSVSVVGSKRPKSFPKSLEAHKIAPAALKILEAEGVKISLIERRDGARSVRPERKRKAKA